MIEFKNVSKTYHIRKFQKHVFTNLNFAIEPGESIGICGANGAGKSTLMRLISGVEHPTSGSVRRSMSTSWPIGYSSCFQGSLTGADNARFIARIYNQPEEEVLAFVEDFAQLGPYLHQPVQAYSAGMSARLVDEVTAAGDERFRARCEEALLHRRDNATLIMISHDPGTLRQYCRRGAVVYGGAVVFYDTVDEANEVHHRLQMRAA
jgi:capsular polysaccharide transport system ATP-binding protein